jgi:OOP family OmpA-OmpF porin
MNSRSALLVSTTLAFAALAPVAAAQSSSGGLNMPYQRDFWGYAGLSYGQARLDATCPPGTGCDDTDQGFRIFGGGRFKGILGGELAWLKLGDFSRAGGETDAKALDLALTAGVPFANNWSVFAKLGAIYGRTTVSGTAAGLQTGDADGFGPRFGLGLQAGLTQNWALRADWDRYRFKMPGGHENIDTLMLGVQYSFR